MEDYVLYELVYSFYKGVGIPQHVAPALQNSIIEAIKHRNSSVAATLILKTVELAPEKERDAWFTVFNLLREGLHIGVMEITIALMKGDLIKIQEYFGKYPSTKNDKVFGVGRLSPLALVVRSAKCDIEEQYVPAASYLLSIGANPNDGSLLYAVCNLCPKILALLLDHGADPNLGEEYASAKQLFMLKCCDMKNPVVDKIRELIM